MPCNCTYRYTVNLLLPVYQGAKGGQKYGNLQGFYSVQFVQVAIYSPSKWPACYLPVLRAAGRCYTTGNNGQAYNSLSSTPSYTMRMIITSWLGWAASTACRSG